MSEPSEGTGTRGARAASRPGAPLLSPGCPCRLIGRKPRAPMIAGTERAGMTLSTDDSGAERAGVSPGAREFK